jgi:hypothetical protein
MGCKRFRQRGTARNRPRDLIENARQATGCSLRNKGKCPIEGDAGAQQQSQLFGGVGDLAPGDMRRTIFWRREIRNGILNEHGDERARFQRDERLCARSGVFDAFDDLTVRGQCLESKSLHVPWRPLACGSSFRPYG